MFAPGTSPDILTRYITNKLQQVSGKPFIVENKVGAFGNIASEYVARAKPDGYTIYVTSSGSTLAAAPYMFKKLSFDPMNDFADITTIAEVPFFLQVAKNTPIMTVADLVTFLREKGDKASYGTLSNAFLVAGEMFKQQFGLKTEVVRYKEPGTMLRDMIAGNLAFVYIDAGGTFYNSGETRAIATSNLRRSKVLPNVPSGAETGIANLDLTGWWAVHAPKGTPKPILDQLEKWINDIVATSEYQTFLEGFRWEPLRGNAALVRERMLAENIRWAEYAKIAKIDLQ